MRFPTRFLKIVAGTLIVLLLAASIAWMTRHAWIPAALNSQLDGVRLTEFHGLHLARSGQGLDAHIQHLRLVTRDQLAFDFRGIQVSRVPSLARALLTASMKSMPVSAISVERLELTSAEISTSETAENTSSTMAPGAPETGPLSRDTATARTAQADAGLSVRDTLDSLRHAPIRTLAIRHILWPDMLRGALSFHAAQTARHAIRGELRSDRCNSCRLEFNVQIDDAQVTLASQLHHDAGVVAQSDSKLHAGKDPVRWLSYSNFRLSAEQLPRLLHQIGLSSSGSDDWLAIAQSLNGSLELTISGEIPDRVTDSTDFRDINAMVEAHKLAFELPESFAGLPLATEITTASPLKLQVHAISPLSVASVEGDLKIRTDLPSTPEASAVTPAFMTSNFKLTTERNIPKVAFRGQVQLEQASQLWASPKWRHLRIQLPVTDMQGAPSFTGVFNLPGIDGLLDKSEAPQVRQFLTEIRLDNEVTFQLALPKDDNPLAAVGWKKLQVKLRGGEPLKISSPQLPGAADLEFSGLSLAVNEISHSGSKEKIPDVQGEISGFRCTGLPAIDCDLQLQLTAPELNLADINTSLKNLKLSLADARISAADSGTVSVTLTELNFITDQVLSGETAMTKPELFAQQARCQLQGETLSCSAPQVALSLNPLSSGDSQLRGVVFLEDLAITRRGDALQGLQATSRFRTDNLSLQALKQYKADFAAQGQWRLKHQLLSGNGDITAGPLAVNTSWQHHLANGKGHLELKLPQAEFAPKNLLSHALHGLPLDIVGGSVQAEAHLHWPQAENNQLRLTFKDAALQYNDSFAVGVNAQAALQQQAGNWVTARPVPVSVDSVDAGVAINNLRFMLSLAGNGDLTLGNFSAELLEGALTADKLYWNLNGEERHSRLQFTGLSIGALAKEMESTNFAASGLLDASIPITTDRQGVTVDEGTVQSRPPGGRLRYYGAFSPGMLGNNPQLKLLAGALEDYNYRDISGTMSYPLSGDLKLNLKLVGRSAAIDANRDLIINLNLENNVPSMLRSLQASRDLTDVLERQVQ